MVNLGVRFNYRVVGIGIMIGFRIGIITIGFRIGIVRWVVRFVVLD